MDSFFTLTPSDALKPDIELRDKAVKALLTTKTEATADSILTELSEDKETHDDDKNETEVM